MNERIKELARQAGFEITPWGDESLPCVHQEGPIDVELEKFAELIVQECISVVLNSSLRPDDMAAIIAHHIRRHFGVKS